MGSDNFNKNAFFSGKKFYDNKNFPNLFHRSGDFSIKEADVLSLCGHVMNQLAKGELQASCPEHEQFLLVINGTQQPTTFEEKVFLKYLKLIDSKAKLFQPMKNKASKESFSEDVADDINDFNDEL